MATIIVCILALLAAGLAIRTRTVGPRRLYHFAKPATMALIILVALLRTGAAPYYKLFVLSGLLASAAGDIILMLPPAWFPAGLASFLLAHVFYILAFRPAAGWSASTATLIPFLVFGLLMFRTLAPKLGALRIPVFVYVAVITAMAWFAAGRFIDLGGWRPLAAFSGALLFLASDAFLAYARFVRDFDAAQPLILGTYFPAQLLIALSI